MNYDRTFGSKFDKSLTLTQIAARVRNDIKIAAKAGDLPKIKCSVRKKDNSINVVITEVPFWIMNDEKLEMDVREPNRYHHGRIHNEQAVELLDKVKKILQAYNYDGSRSEVDYFDVNYYGFVKFDYTLEAKERELMVRQIALAA